MSDRQTAAIVLGLLAVGFLLWYRRQDEARRAALFGAGGGMPSPGGAAAAPPAGKDAPPAGKDALKRLFSFAARHNLTVTSSTGGVHNPGSAHYQRRAIDVRSRGLLESTVAQIKAFAAAAGIRVRDERTWPAGQGVWDGPHLHLEIPR